MPAPSPHEIESFYRAAMLGLRFLEAREGRAAGTGRRFGKVADDTWAALGGELEEADRLDLLLRDASVAHALAFSGRGVFALRGLAEDEPFGPAFPRASGKLSAELGREARSGTAVDGAALLEQAASTWGLGSLAGADALAGRITSLGPATRLVVTGARAIAALSLAALSPANGGRRDLDLADQVVLVTSRPAERQLFGLALVLLATRTPPKVAAPADANADLARRWKLSRVDVALVGSDADDAARAAALGFARELDATSIVDEGNGTSMDGRA